MKFLIISHVAHKKQNNQYFAYEPYVNEMNIWLKHADEVEVIAPFSSNKISNIDTSYRHKSLKFTRIPEIQFTTLGHGLRSLFLIPIIFISIFKACIRANHIHLRCPGNIGLIGCLVQMFFPKKIKTAKYAGNWDPKSNQPLSYRFQKKILSNTFLTRNMQVLVYGDYGEKSVNIKPFFTASFHEKDIEPIIMRDYELPLKFLFVGSIVSGKRPLMALQIIEELNKKGVDASIDFYGSGDLLLSLKDYVEVNNLSKMVEFKGNKSRKYIKSALKSAHFLILLSKSEGWPKVVAEAMFFGTIPIATSISCVPQMLGDGKRGVLIQPEVNLAVKTISEFIETNKSNQMVKEAAEWSRQYTLEKFDKEIGVLVTR